MMRRRTSLGLVIVAILASNAWADVVASVYLADEQTPLPLLDPNVPDVYRDVMVGTRLTIFVSSDTFGGWQGFLRIPREEMGIGRLSARGRSDDPNHPNYNREDSCLETAGSYPFVTSYNFPAGLGFDLFADVDAIPGDWFVLDYHAKAVGRCNVEYWHYYWDEDYQKVIVDLLQVLSFSHVPSRDFDDDGIVNFVDFAPLASQWRQVAITDPNMNGSADLNADGVVNTLDLASFSDYWLQWTDVNEPDTEPNVPTADP